MIGGIEHYLPPLQLQFHALHLVSLADMLVVLPWALGILCRDSSQFQLDAGW